MEAYSSASTIATHDLPPTHPIRYVLPECPLTHPISLSLSLSPFLSPSFFLSFYFLSLTLCVSHYSLSFISLDYSQTRFGPELFRVLLRDLKLPRPCLPPSKTGTYILNYTTQHHISSYYTAQSHQIIPHNIVSECWRQSVRLRISYYTFITFFFVIFTFCFHLPSLLLTLSFPYPLFSLLAIPYSFSLNPVVILSSSGSIGNFSNSSSSFSAYITNLLLSTRLSMMP